MKRLKTNEQYFFKSVKTKEEKPSFKNNNKVTIVRLVVGEPLEFNGEFLNNEKHFDFKSESVVKTFSVDETKVFVNTENQTFLFENLKK